MCIYIYTHIHTYIHIYLLTYFLTYLHIYLLTYLLTPWSRVLLDNLTGLQLVKEFPTFYGTRMFITAFTSAHHLSLSWASSIQSISQSHFLEFHLNIILPSTPGSPQWALSLRFPHQDPIHPSPLTHTRYVPRPSHSSWYYHSHNIGWAVQIIFGAESFIFQFALYIYIYHDPRFRDCKVD